MCALRPPFNGQNLHMLAIQIVSGKYMPLPAHFSEEMKQTIKLLLTVDEKKRPSINELLRMPSLSNRIRKLLNDQEFKDEFSHTVLHK